MNLKDQFTYATKTTLKRKKQTFLTSLGVLIGIAAIVSMVALSQGYEKTIVDQLEGTMNTKTLTISTRDSFFGPPGGDVESVELYQSDLDILKTIDNVELVVGTYSKSVTLLGAGDVSFRTTLIGVNFTDYPQVYGDFESLEGSEIADLDPSGDYVLLGYALQNVSDEISFEIGDVISIQWTDSDTEETLDYNLEIGSILKEIGASTSAGGPSDMNIYISEELFLELYGETSVNSITVLLDSDDSTIIDSVTEAIEDLYGSQLMIQSAGSMVDTMLETFQTTQMLLAGLAAISLLVAGIGIMNIMTVSLMQRTREIGLLKAMGANGTEILSIFLFESLFIGALGSLGGIGVGFILAYIFGNSFGDSSSIVSGGGGGGGSRMMGVNMNSMFSTQIIPYIDATSVILIFLFGILISVVFGLLPAWRASKLEPIEALREE